MLDCVRTRTDIDMRFFVFGSYVLALIIEQLNVFVENAVVIKK